MVLEEHGIPLAVRSVHQSSLGDPCFPEDDPAFVGAGDPVRPVDQLGAHGVRTATLPRPGDQEYVISPVNLMDMGAFGRHVKTGTGDAAGPGDNYLVKPAFFHRVHFRGQLNNANIATAIDQINPAVVI